MKKSIQICIYVVMFIAIAASAGSMMVTDPSTNLHTAQIKPEQSLHSSGVIDFNELQLSAPDRHPVEPAILFLFGTGVIGIIVVHRLKFK